LNLIVLQFYAHNICIVHKIKEMDLKKKNFMIIWCVNNKRYFTNLAYHPFLHTLYVCSFINNKIIFQ
jgi:hypothetical protein